MLKPYASDIKRFKIPVTFDIECPNCGDKRTLDFSHHETFEYPVLNAPEEHEYECWECGKLLPTFVTQIDVDFQVYLKEDGPPSKKTDYAIWILMDQCAGPGSKTGTFAGQGDSLASAFEYFNKKRSEEGLEVLQQDTKILEDDWQTIIGVHTKYKDQDGNVHWFNAWAEPLNIY